MIFSLRRLVRSRRLLAMGLLAWAMLVTHALAAAPMGMAGVPHSHAAPATIAAASGHDHHPATTEASRSCCDDQGVRCDGMTGHVCHCDAMCSTTLAPAMVVLDAPAAITVRYAMPLPGRAPSLDDAPPLRPPAA